MLQVKGHFIKNHLCVFVNGLVENPAFNSQSKEALTTKETQFGSSPKISDAGLKALEKSEIVDRCSERLFPPPLLARASAGPPTAAAATAASVFCVDAAFSAVKAFICRMF